MSDLSTNKALAAVLATALVIVGLNAVIPEFFQKKPPAKPGYLIAVAADVAGGGAAAPEGPPAWGTVLKTADPAAGEAKTAACKSCHNFDPAGTNGIGPGLYGVLGRKPGSHPGFAYSPAMTAFAAKQPIWDFDHIYDFIAGPQKYLPGTKMTFIGLKQAQDRINVIAYLHTLGSSLPIPAAKPAALAAPAAPTGPAGAKAPGAASAGQPTAAPAGAPASAKPGTPTPAVEPAKPGGPA